MSNTREDAYKRMVDRFYAITAIYRRFNGNKIQDKRNEIATDILNKVNKGGKIQDYVLYLRPFSTSGQLAMMQDYQIARRRLISARSALLQQEMSELQVYLLGDMELQFADALWSSRLPLVALLEIDRDEQGQGAGRIQEKFGDDWLCYVSKLAEKAKGIIVTLVSDGGVSGQGTINEIQMLRNKELLDKTLFFVPVLTDGSNQKSFQKEWKETRTIILNQIGISLPNFQPDDFFHIKGYFLKYVTEYSIFVEIPVDSFIKCIFPGR
ncbi:MAG: hypothetical protein HC874_22515 [Richelia sp. SL_2_1]|nr:hypothetical protein [Richelia sp. SL_2_1]